jgi:demethylmenaquinone methyltransferase/2-methoxy-6-polyprenyl-1,4-benzoquinol methylase
MTVDKGYDLDKFYSKIYKRYDLINKLFTFGLDRKWRRIMVEKSLENAPKTILDLCCGTGDITIALCKKAHADIAVTGYDFNAQMLDQARIKSEKQNLSSIHYIQGNAASLPFTESQFDTITISFGFRNLTFNNPNRDNHIAEMLRVLKPGGRLLILESGVPQNALVKVLYNLYLYLFLIPMGGVISGNLKAYWYLAHSSSKFYSVKELEQLLKEKGFSKFKYQSFFLGAANLFIAEK